MPSKVLLNRIAALKSQLAELEALAAAEAPALPSGFVVAEIVSTDTTSCKYNDYCPDEEIGTGYVVVPEELGDKVYGLWSSSGAEYCSGIWSEPRWYAGSSSWGYSHEEAVTNFFAWHDAENNPGWPNQSEDKEEE